MVRSPTIRIAVEPDTGTLEVANGHAAKAMDDPAGAAGRLTRCLPALVEAMNRPPPPHLNGRTSLRTRQPVDSGGGFAKCAQRPYNSAAALGQNGDTDSGTTPQHLANRVRYSRR